MWKGSHVCSSLLNSIFAHNLSNSSGSHWHPKGVLAPFLCSCRRQDVLSTLYHRKEIPAHETRDQCVSPPGEKTWALEFQSSSKNGKIYTENLFTEVPASLTKWVWLDCSPPSYEIDSTVPHRAGVTLEPQLHSLWLEERRSHRNLSLLSRAE